MGKLTKIAIIDEIVLSTGLSKKEASEAFETLLDIIKFQLEKGDDVFAYPQISHPIKIPLSAPMKGPVHSANRPSLFGYLFRMFRNDSPFYGINQLDTHLAAIIITFSTALRVSTISESVKDSIYSKRVHPDKQYLQVHLQQLELKPVSSPQ